MALRTLPELLGCILLLAHSGATRNLAAKPPMGWNSWDAYGLTIDESQFCANAQVLAGLKNNHFEPRRL